MWMLVMIGGVVLTAYSSDLGIDSLYTVPVIFGGMIGQMVSDWQVRDSADLLVLGYGKDTVERFKIGRTVFLALALAPFAYFYRSRLTPEEYPVFLGVLACALIAQITAPWPCEYDIVKAQRRAKRKGEGK